MKQILCSLLSIYLLILIARALLSWFPQSHSGGMATVNRVLFDLTEPVLAPLRRVIPPAGMFDLSFLVLLIGIEILMRAMNCGFALF